MLVAFFVCFFTVILFIYSLGFIKRRRITYYSWFFLSFLGSLGAIFSNHLILLVIFWGFLGLALFKLINIYSDRQTAQVAKKTFIIIGGSDGFLLLGALIYASLAHSFFLKGSPLAITNSLSFLAFLFIAIGAFAKAGCMPFHTWIPDTTQEAPVPVVAYLPASLDKLLGIYLLARIVKDTFILNDASRMLLFILGALTVICAVMMALIQHNIKKLLGFHAVSQVGYMVLGIACASPLGLAGGLFHMINNAIYKSCLFLGAGNVEKKARTSELHALGGLGAFMPITFAITLIASFSISGIPPLNGFVSKWMIYQGLIDALNTSGSFAMKLVIALSLVAALVGSGLTLASFLKLNAGVFLGQASRKTKEVGALLLIPGLILAFLCVIFGIFASVTILPLITKSVGTVSAFGVWMPQAATALIILGILIGVIVFKLMTQKMRVSSRYTGGEDIKEEELDVKVAPFYNTVKELGFLGRIYQLAERKTFDIYEQLVRLASRLTRFLQYLHNGVLPTYLVWCLIGVMALFFIFLR